MLWVTVAWGACFVAIQWGLRDAPVLWFATMRALIAGAALVALAVVQHHPHPSGVRSWSLILLMGLANVTIGFAAMFAGVAGLATGAAAVLANAQPLLIVLPAWWIYGERPSRSTALALLLGFGGLLAVAVPGGGGTRAWLSLAAAAAITAGTLLSRRLGQLDVLTTVGWHFIIGGLMLVGLALAAEGRPSVSWTPRFVAVLAFLSLVGTAAAFVVWFTEAQRCRLDQLAAWTFLVPVVGIALSAAVLGETMTTWSAAGLALVLASLWVALRPSRRDPAPRDDERSSAASGTFRSPGRTSRTQANTES